MKNDWQIRANAYQELTVSCREGPVNFLTTNMYIHKQAGLSTCSRNLPKDKFSQFKLRYVVSVNVLKVSTPISDNMGHYICSLTIQT